MGAADTTWVMQRKRTSKNADIILTGRDLDRRTLYLHEENCIWLLGEEETAEEQRLKAVPEYLWRVAEYIGQAGKWQGTATELLSAVGVDGVLPHMLTRKIVEHFDTVLAPKGIHYEMRRTSQTRLLKFSHPFIGGIPLARIRPLTLEEMCKELRKRPGRNGSVKECTVQKYLETVSSVLEDAKKNDIIPFNPAHRVRKKCAEKEKQHIPQKYEMQRLLQIIMDEPILYKAYYTMAIATGLRRGELCALRWEDITGPYKFTIRHSRSYVAGQGIVESDTKNHRERVIVIPAQVWEFLMSLRHWQTIRSGKPENNQPIFADLDGHVPNPDTFTRHLRKLYAKNGFPKEYHLHTLRHYYATYLLQEGTSKQVAADLLGHADTAFLERTYCHPQNMAKREAANLMEDLLSPKNIYHQPFKFVLKGKKVG